MDDISKYKKMVATAVASNDPSLMNNINDVIDEFLCETECECSHCYWKLIRRLHCAVYGPHFDEKMAKYAVSQMMNDDGTKGEHWTPTNTLAVANSSNIVFTSTTFNEWDWYFTLNMMYSDYFKYLASNTDAYVNLAKLYLNDADVPVGKAYRYWSYVVKAE